MVGQLQYTCKKIPQIPSREKDIAHELLLFNYQIQKGEIFLSLLTDLKI